MSLSKTVFVSLAISISLGSITWIGCGTNGNTSKVMESEQADQPLAIADAINKTCPRSGKPIVDNSLAEYRGYTVGFCNQHCRDDFASDIAAAEKDRAFFDRVISELKK